MNHRISMKRREAFTLAELLVSVAVLALLIALIAQLFTSAQAVMGMENKHMDADSQARALFDRMAIDFAQMVKRPDVDYFLKDASNAFLQGDKNPAGNDQLAFFSQVPGYFSGSGSLSPVSLVGYRVNTDSAQLQRFGCGLLWNGVPDSSTPLVFLPVKIADKWPSATSMQAGDTANYELAGPQVFRMEYYYVLKGQTFAVGTFASQLSSLPWDARIQGIPGVADHTSVSGLRDVAAIGVVIAVADAKSWGLVTNDQLAQLAAQMKDFSTCDTPKPGDLEAQWQQAIHDSGLPRIAASGIRIYRRWFYLSSGSPLNP